MKSVMNHALAWQGLFFNFTVLSMKDLPLSRYFRTFKWMSLKWTNMPGSCN